MSRVVVTRLQVQPDVGSTLITGQKLGNVIGKQANFSEALSVIRIGDKEDSHLPVFSLLGFNLEYFAPLRNRFIKH